jgi:hypothetical protein
MYLPPTLCSVFVARFSVARLASIVAVFLLGLSFSFRIKGNASWFVSFFFFFLFFQVYIFFPASQRIDLLLNELRKTHTY